MTENKPITPERIHYLLTAHVIERGHASDVETLARLAGCSTEAGLKSPVVRNRNFAVAALAAWARGEWPGGLEESLEWAAGCEPNEDVREPMRKALRGELLSP
jgi:hypothetical protein